jgi:hypothetical protein
MAQKWGSLWVPKKFMSSLEPTKLEKEGFCCSPFSLISPLQSVAMLLLLLLLLLCDGTYSAGQIVSCLSVA